MLVDDGIICLLCKIEDYPKVERKPETDPSAYREIMSPMWRKEAVPAISMFQIWPNLLMNSQTYDLPHFEFVSRKFYAYGLLLWRWLTTYQGGGLVCTGGWGIHCLFEGLVGVVANKQAAR